jgi:hypothetical protein
MIKKFKDPEDVTKDKVEKPNENNEKYFKTIRAHRIYQLAMSKYKEMRYLGGK